MRPPEISIIVPVYNAERYLSHCIDSILNQTFKDFELLLVNDGSSDGSGKLCDEYARKVQSPMIKAIHQDNKGSSAARQVGFESAQGKYIVAIDADDWVDENYIEDMLRIMETQKADIVMSAYWFNFDGQDVYMANKPSSDKVVVWQKDFLQGPCHAGLWNKMLRKDILLSGKVIVPQYSYYEDMAISISYLEQCTKLTYNGIAAYHYRHTDTSLTNTPNEEKRLLRLYEMVHNMADLYQSLAIDKQAILKSDIESRVINEKWMTLDTFPDTYLSNKDLYDFFTPLVFPIRKVKGISTLSRFLLLQGISTPYKLLKRFRGVKRKRK